MEFVHLHVHSVFSLMRGTARIDAICRAVKHRGMSRFALTDTNNLYGLIFFLQTAKEHGISPIIGAEIRKNSKERAVVLVKDMQGYRNLCSVISMYHCLQDFDLIKTLLEHNEGTVILSSHIPLLSALKGRADCYAELVRGREYRHVMAFAREEGIPAVVTGGVFFIDPEDFAVHRLARAIDLNTTLSKLPKHECAPEDAYLADISEITASFPDVPDVVFNTAEISQKCTFTGDFGRVITPGFKGLSRDEEIKLLRKNAEQGIEKRYGARTPEVCMRLEYELSLIEQKGFASVFLVVEDIVRQSNLTCGRGSAAASIVSYLLGITNVDPVKYNLYFERFLNPGRTDPPDIDIDFAWDERDGIFDYIFAKYGRSGSAMVSNHVGFRPRAAVREVAKVYGFPENQIKRITDRLAHLWYWRGESVEEVIKSHPVFKGLVLDRRWIDVIKQSRKIAGLVRHISVHCGGVVITPEEITSYVPVEPAPKGVNVIQWDKDQTEDSGLVKIDILGNRSLAVIRDAIAAIRENTGRIIDYTSFNPVDDSMTKEIIAKGDTMGVFYIESPAMRQLQKKTGKGDYEHLIIHSSIIRPAANNFINEYIRRLKGEKIKPVHPVFDRVLKDTYGIMVYQEDVTKIAVEMAGFSSAMGDGLRKTLSKKHNSRKLDYYRDMFFKGAQKKGISEKVIKHVWNMILSFGGYSFCKPHSASYALVSFKSAYLRARYPAEFMAAVISNRGGYYSTFAYISEARRMGLRVLGPDINLSVKKYKGAGREIRMGFMQLKGLREKTLDSILNERKANGAYRSLEEFIYRVDPDPSDLEIFIKAGCFDSIEKSRTRPQLLWIAKVRENNKKAEHQTSLDLFDNCPSVTPALDSYDPRTLVLFEVEILGFPLTLHPLDLYRHITDRIDHIDAVQMKDYTGKTVRMIGWWITNKTVYTKNQEPMAFISFEDKTGIYETVFFPDAYRKYASKFSPAFVFVLKGKVEEQFGALSLTVYEMSTVTRRKGVKNRAIGMFKR